MKLFFCLDLWEYPSPNNVLSVVEDLKKSLEVHNIKIHNDIELEFDIPHCEMTEEMVEDGLLSEEEYNECKKENDALLEPLYNSLKIEIKE